jgi:hypothetical protein
MNGAMPLLPLYAFVEWTGTHLLLLSFYYKAVALRKCIGPCLRIGGVLAKLHAFLIAAFDGDELASILDRLAAFIPVGKLIFNCAGLELCEVFRKASLA